MTDLRPEEPRPRLSGRLLCVAACLALAFTVIYGVVAPSVEHQNWDSLSYASASEGTPYTAILGNHPLPHVVFDSVIGAARACGYDGRALRVLLWFNAVLAGIAVGVIFILGAGVIGAGVPAGLGMALLFGASSGLLRYAGTADIYAMTLLLASASWLALARAARSGTAGSWLRWGCLVGVAVLVHQFNVLLAPVGAAVALRGERRRLRNTALFAAAVTLTMGLGYGLSGWLATRSLSPVAIFKWFAGYFGSGAYGMYLRFDYVPVAAEALYHTLACRGWGTAAILAHAMLIAGVALLGLRALPALARGDRTQRFLLAAALTHCLLSWILVLWYEPWNPKFWLVTFVPACVFLMAGAGSRLPAGSSGGNVLLRLFGLLPLACGGFLLAFNIWYQGLPQRVDSPAYKEAIDAWVSHTTPHDMLMTVGDLTAQLRFRENRPYAATPDLFARNPSAADPFGAVREKIAERHRAGRNVYVAEPVGRYVWSVLRRAGAPSGNEVDDFLASYEREQAFSYQNTIDGSETPVCRLMARADGAEARE